MPASFNQNTDTVKVTIEAEIAGLKRDLKAAQKEIENFTKTASSSTDKASSSFSAINKTTKGTIVQMAALATTTYGVAKAMKTVVASGLKYNREMENARASLEAMVKSSLTYTDVQGRMVSASERTLVVNREVRETMDAIKEILPETSYMFKDLIELYSLAKPAADQFNISTQDQVDVLKLLANAAQNFGLEANSLKMGIDNLYNASWITNAAFGRMLTSLGITKEEMAATADKAGYLKAKLAEAGQMADTFDVAVSNLNESWYIMTSQLTEPIWEPLKDAIKELTFEMGTNGVNATGTLTDAFVSFSKAAVGVIQVVMQGVIHLVGAISTAWDGFKAIGIKAMQIWTDLKKGATSVGRTIDYMFNGYENFGKYEEMFRRLNKESEAWNAEMDKVGQNVADKMLLTMNLSAAVERVGMAYRTATFEAKKYNEAETELTKRGPNKPPSKKSSRAKQRELKDLIRINEELAKQAKLEYEIAIKTGKAGFKISLDKYRIAQKELILRKEALKLSAALKSGSLSQLEIEKQRTKMLEAQVELIKAQSEDIDRWQNMFSSLAGGDFNSAFDSIFGDMFKGMQNSLASSIGGTLGNIVSGGMGFIVDGLVGALGSIFNSSVSEEELQAARGIYEVLSGTISNSIQMLEKNSQIGLKHSAAMLEALQSSDRSTKRAVSNIGGNLTGENYVGKESPGIFGLFASKRELLSIGVEIQPASIKELSEGMLKGTEYMMEKVTKSGFFGIGGGTSIKRTDLGDADAKLMQGISEAYMQSIDAMREAATVFGMTADEFNSVAESWATSLNQLNFAGKSPEEIVDLINGVIGADMDRWASSLAGVAEYVERLGLAGEGAGEAMIRLAYQFETVNEMFKDLSIGAIDAANGGIELANALVQATGGMDSFLGHMRTFEEEFYTEAERTAMAGRRLSQEFERLGIAMPSTAAGFRQLVESLLASADAAYQKVAALELEIAAATAAGDAITAAALQIQLAAAQAAAEAASEQAASVLALSRPAANFYKPMQAAGRAMEDAAKAADRLRESVAKLEASWIKDDVESAQFLVDFYKKETGLRNVTYDNFLESFRKAKGGMTEEVLRDWQSLGDALKKLYDAQTELLKEEYNLLNDEVSFYEDLLSKVDDMFLGSLSYLTSEEKIKYAEEAALRDLEQGNTSGYFDKIKESLAYEKAMSTTREEYMLKFDEAMSKLKGIEYEPEKTTDDVVTAIEEANEKLDDLKDAIERASYAGV